MIFEENMLEHVKDYKFVNTITEVLFSLSILQCFLFYDLKHRRWHHWEINVAMFMTLL